MNNDDHDYDEHQDSLASYYEAVRVIGEKCKETGDIPEFFKSTRGSEYPMRPQ